MFDRKSSTTRLAVIPESSGEFLVGEPESLFQASDHLRRAPFAGGLGERDQASSTKKFALTDPSVMVAFMLVDGLVIFLGSIVSWLFYHQAFASDLPNWSLYVISGASFGAIFVLNGLRGSSYGFLWGLQRSEAVIKIFRGFVQTYLLFVTFLVFTHWSVYYSRVTLILQFSVCGGFILLLRSCQLSLLQSATVNRYLVSNRAVLVGDEDEIEIALNDWRRRKENILVLKQFSLSKLQLATEKPEDDLHTFAEDLVLLCRNLKPDRIVVFLPVEKRKIINFLSQRFAELPVSILISTKSLATAESKVSTHTIGGLGMLRIVRKPLTVTDRIMKRSFDLFIASFMFVILLPFFLVIGFAIKIDSPGSVFFVQRRRGFNQDEFRIFKFRTMISNSSSEGFRQTAKDDCRVTRFGSWLRRWNIDELPQLLNVILGEMSLVGPRPHAVEHDDMYYSHIAIYARRHNMKPGITGLAQARGFRGATETVQQMQDRVDQDMTYIQNWSLLLDFKILLMTVFSARAYRNAF